MNANSTSSVLGGPHASMRSRPWHVLCAERTPCVTGIATEHALADESPSALSPLASVVADPPPGGTIGSNEIRPHAPTTMPSSAQRTVSHEAGRRLEAHRIDHVHHRL